jgi:hypothetical protein
VGPVGRLTLPDRVGYWPFVVLRLAIGCRSHFVVNIHQFSRGLNPSFPAIRVYGLLMTLPPASPTRPRIREDLSRWSVKTDCVPIRKSAGASHVADVCGSRR